MIVRNSAKCLLCGDEIESKSVHDFVMCGCGNIFVDGGREYVRCGASVPDAFVSTAVFEIDYTVRHMEGDVMVVDAHFVDKEVAVYEAQDLSEANPDVKYYVYDCDRVLYPIMNGHMLYRI